LEFLKRDFEIMAFVARDIYKFLHIPVFNALGFLKKSKKSAKIWLFLFFLSGKGLILTMHCLSCIFITNFFLGESVTMQGAYFQSRMWTFLQFQITD